MDKAHKRAQEQQRAAYSDAVARGNLNRGPTGSKSNQMGSLGSPVMRLLGCCLP